MTLTYLNDPALKDAFMAKMRLHASQDALIQGQYGNMNGGFKGCFVGCALHSLYGLKKYKAEALNEAETWGDHALFPKLLGIPEGFARLADKVFEGLTVEDSKWWALALPDAIPVGADLTPAWHRIIARTLREVAVFDKKKFPAVDKAVDGMAALHDEAASGQSVSEDRWAAGAAWAAGADRTARAAGAAWAARAAWAAEAAWAARAAWAAEAASTAEAAEAASTAAWKRIALIVIEEVQKP